MIQKYIISGAPGTGKTTIINALKKKDYYCAEEISRELIAEQISIGGSILPWKDQIANRRYKQYLDSPENCICFFDRSSVDCIAYLNDNKLEFMQGLEAWLNNTSNVEAMIERSISSNEYKLTMNINDKQGTKRKIKLS